MEEGTIIFLVYGIGIAVAFLFSKKFVTADDEVEGYLMSLFSWVTVLIVVVLRLGEKYQAYRKRKRSGRE